MDGEGLDIVSLHEDSVAETTYFFMTVTKFMIFKDQITLLGTTLFSA